MELVISDAHLRPRKSATARRTRDSSGASYPTLPGRAIQALGPRCQPARAPDSAAASQITLDNPSILDEDMRDLGDRIKDMLEQYCAVIDSRANPDVPPVTRRDVKLEPRPTGDYTEERPETLTNRIIDVARSGS